MMGENREVELWCCDPDAERLSDQTREDAIESYMDGRDMWEGTIQVHGFARMVVNISASLPEMVIETVFEHLEEYTDPEEGPDTTPEMLKAANAFIAAMLKEFHVWACEVITTEDVDVLAWIENHRPDWLKEKS
ncbi:MAG: hypothetical protein V3V24_09795 [Nitrospinaceae bacterium]